MISWNGTQSPAPPPLLETELHYIRRTLSKYLHSNFDLSLKRLKVHFYAHHNKSGACLAKQLNCLLHTKISYLTSTNHTCLTNPKDISHRFSQFYANLYNLAITDKAPSPTPSDIAQFLDHLHLPFLSPEQIHNISRPFSNSKLESAIASLPLHKAPGPDGFINEYYKHFSTLLTPYLRNLFNHMLSTGLIPSEALAATITTIPKPGIPADDASSYRPISLLNTKLCAKLLASRISDIIPHLVHPGQVGFVNGRQASNYTRRYIDLMQWLEHHRIPSLFISLDAEKKFDRVD